VKSGSRRLELGERRAAGRLDRGAAVNLECRQGVTVLRAHRPAQQRRRAVEIAYRVFVTGRVLIRVAGR
jgi:hypothetical protein